MTDEKNRNRIVCGNEDDGLGGWGESLREKGECPDCKAKLGEYHVEGCDVERCEICRFQRISCGCHDNDE